LETKIPATEKSKTGAGVLGSGPCDLDKLKGRLHFIGIGGIGMSALARLILSRGIPVSGSDKQGNKITDHLSKLGATIYTGHAASNASGAAGMVVSTAITSDNPELNWARANNLPIWHRSEILAALAKDRKLIAISGTHGKTTTTAMIGKLFIDAGVDPSIVIGGVLPLLQSNCRIGKGEHFIAEADESDGTHTTLPADIAVVTNVEADHLENYPDGMKQILATMKQFAKQANKVILCTDDAGCQNLAKDLKNKIIGYGKKSTSLKDGQFKSTYQFEDISDASNSAIKIYKNDNAIGTLQLSVPGIHNQYNALATVAVGLESGLDFETIAKSLSGFAGVDRRFQIIGEAQDILIVDDYAHHPTEVIATLQAAKQYVEQNKFAAKRIVAVFQPHQPGRLKDFWTEFCNAFGNCDLLLLTDVYIARGAAIPGINSKKFSEEVKNSNCHYLAGPTSELAKKIKEYIQPNDLVITIGAGDITNIGPQLLQLLS
jgi:UDP-N-acetylmuramate--alanine ligase